MAHITDAVLTRHHRVRRSRVEAGRHWVGHVRDRAHLTSGDVVGSAEPRGAVRASRLASGDVGDVHEVATLPAILEHRRGPTGLEALRTMLATPAYGVSRGIRGP